MASPLQQFELQLKLHQTIQKFDISFLVA